MQNNIIWFENVDGKQLKLITEIISYDNEPMLFICSDEEQKYLCTCFEMYGGFKWAITKVSDKMLLKLWEKNISIYEVFQEKGTQKYIIEKDMPDYKERCQQVKKFEDKMLPEKEMVLELCSKDAEYFFSLLNIECAIQEFAVTEIEFPIIYNLKKNDWNQSENQSQNKNGTIKITKRKNCFQPGVGFENEDKILQRAS